MRSDFSIGGARQGPRAEKERARKDARARMQHQRWRRRWSRWLSPLADSDWPSRSPPRPAAGRQLQHPRAGERPAAPPRLRRRPTQCRPHHPVPAAFFSSPLCPPPRQTRFRGPRALSTQFIVVIFSPLFGFFLSTTAAASAFRRHDYRGKQRARDLSAPTTAAARPKIIIIIKNNFAQK